jgi:hypothetical protein
VVTQHRTQMVIDIKQGLLKLQGYFGNILNQFVDNLNISHGYMPYQGTKRFLKSEQGTV